MFYNQVIEEPLGNGCYRQCTDRNEITNQWSQCSSVCVESEVPDSLLPLSLTREHLSSRQSTARKLEVRDVFQYWKCNSHLQCLAVSNRCPQAIGIGCVAQP